MDWQKAGCRTLRWCKTRLGSRQQLFWQWCLATEDAVERQRRMEEFLTI